MLSFSPEALAGYPGPVLHYDGNGSLIEALPADNALVQALRAGQAADVTDLVDAVLAGQAARFGTCTLEATAETHAYDVTVLPLHPEGALVLARDVTLHHNLRAALVESRQRYKDFVEISSDFAWETNAEGTFVFVSSSGALGESASSLVGRNPADLLIERNDALEFPFHTAVPIEDQEVWLRRADGKAACVEVSAKPVYDRDGRRIGARGVCRDVTRERARDAQLARARNRERIVNHIVRTFRDEVDPQNMLRVAAETLARGMGAAACQIFRRATPAEAATVAVEDAALPDRLRLGGAYGALDLSDVVDVLTELWQTGDLVEGGAPGLDALALPTRYHHEMNGAVVLWRAESRGPWTHEDQLLLADIADQIGIANEQIAAHQSIVQLSRTDGLTGLFNRRAFFEELRRRYARLRHDAGVATLMYVDLDNFKMVNDQHGHAEGDRVLYQVREMLVGNSRPTDLVARLGGDEFALWLEGGGRDIAIRKAETLLRQAEERLTPLSGHPDFPLGFSIGLAVHDPAHPETLEELVARADNAMYAVKRRGKFGWAEARSAEAPDTEAGP